MNSNNNNGKANIKVDDIDTSVENAEVYDYLDGYAIIGMGNTGTNIVKAISYHYNLNDVKLFAIDSITNSIDIDTVNKIKYIPIISDEKAGSGRNRERGAAMYQYHHETNPEITNMYETVKKCKDPVIIITSAAGGTGSGSTPVLCDYLIRTMGRHVIPIIIIPSADDPTAYHLNTSDLFIELENVGVQTYGVFQNPSGDRNYGPINEDVVNFIEIILGKKYGVTRVDSIDESDLDQLLNTPGRIMAVSAKSKDNATLKRQLNSSIMTGYQPAWTSNDATSTTFITAYSLKSMFASSDFKDIFEDVRKRVGDVFDEYSNVEDSDNNGFMEATAIIAGLPRPNITNIDGEWNGTASMGSGMKKSVRPNFMRGGNGHNGVTQVTDKSGNTKPVFKWNKKNN